MTTHSYFNNLKLIHRAFAASIVALMLGSVVLSSIDVVPVLENNNDDFSNLLNYLVIGIGIANIALGFLVFNIQVKQAKNESLEKKLLHYRTGFVIRTATIEGSALFAIVAYMLTGVLQNLLISGFMLGFLLILGPGKTDLIKSYELDGAELNQIENETSDISLK